MRLITYIGCLCNTETKHLQFASCAGDETLRFWSVFSGTKATGAAANDSLVSSMMCAHIQ